VPLVPTLVTLLLGFALSLGLTYAAIKLGFTFGIVARPGGRRTHTHVTPKLGVLPLFGAFTLTALASRAFGVQTTDPNETTRLIGVLLGGAVVFVLAILDDKFDLPAGAQFGLQALAALIAIGSQVFLERFTNPFNGKLFIVPDQLGSIAGYAVVAGLTLFWFLGMMNTVNFLDGVDGLASTVALIATAVVTIHMLREGQYSVALLPIALIGVLLGFLVFNWAPARIFLGGGALMLGWLLACVGIIGGAKIALLLLVMGLPIADVLWQIIDRARHGRNPTTAADRGHLHLRLADQGWPAQRIVAVYAAACILFGGAALLNIQPLAKLVTLIALFAVVIGVMMRLSRPTRLPRAIEAIEGNS
jgi:UDP-GlcNAc:undecaprenyl-phosphate GlcNAc-1-phosphate transferase